MEKNTVKDGIKGMPMHGGQDRCFRSFVPERSVNGKLTRTIILFICTALSGPVPGEGRVHFQEIQKGSTPESAARGFIPGFPVFFCRPVFFFTGGSAGARGAARMVIMAVLSARQDCYCGTKAG
jgi:hypothetical protein